MSPKSVKKARTGRVLKSPPGKNESKPKSKSVEKRPLPKKPKMTTDWGIVGRFSRARHHTILTTTPPAPAVAADLDAGKGDSAFVSQHRTGLDGAVGPPAVASDGTGGVEPSAVEVSPGKNLDKLGGEESLVADYSNAINEEWRRGVDALMRMARHCADADVQLTPAQKAELIATLPFEEATFSKFVQIGNDARVHKPEVQLLLPPHYTTVYELTTLKDDELNRAIAEKIISPGMTRGTLLKWRKGHRKPVKEKGVADSATVAPAHGAVKNGVVRSASGQGETQLEFPLELPTTDAQTTSAAQAPEVINKSATEMMAPSMAPTGNEGIAQDRSLSAADQHAFDAVMVAFEAASPAVRERVRAEILRLDTIKAADSDPNRNLRGVVS